MIHMPLFKCLLLAALSVLSCVDAVAPSTTADVAFDATTKMDPEMRGGRALGTAPSPEAKPSASPTDCTELNDETTCTKRDMKRVNERTQSQWIQPVQYHTHRREEHKAFWLLGAYKVSAKWSIFFSTQTGGRWTAQVSH